MHIVKRLLLVLFLVILQAEAAADTYGTSIAIDIGHTRDNPGVTSARGREEFYFNKVIAEKLYDSLHKYGYTNAFIINPSGRDITLIERTDEARAANSELMISIHHDSMQPQFLHKWIYKREHLLYGNSFDGFSLFISQDINTKEDNLSLSMSIARKLLSYGLSPSLHHAIDTTGENRKLIDKKLGIYSFPELAILRRAVMPAILVECGVIVNKDEEILLSNEQYQDKIVKALTEGIISYLDDE
jgi:N-acetylmuramoyl-L-alanine amidase